MSVNIPLRPNARLPQPRGKTMCRTIQRLIWWSTLTPFPRLLAIAKLQKIARRGWFPFALALGMPTIGTR